MRLLVSNIGIRAGIENAGKIRLRGEEMKSLVQIDNAWLLV